ncbi:F-actin-capping protein subunit alpha [Aix galericulata]|nr:F-actin-capping protein subunit alpha [Aix galericulata]
MSVKQSEPEKVSLICRLLRQSPPGEFGQVVQDLYALVKDDELVRQEAAHVGAHHNKKNFTPVQHRRHRLMLTGNHNYAKEELHVEQLKRRTGNKRRAKLSAVNLKRFCGRKSVVSRTPRASQPSSF